MRNGKASIIPERCIDCGECIRVCPNNAKTAVTDDYSILKQYKYNIAITLPILYGQFGTVYTPKKILSALKSLGFDEVYDTSMGSEIFDIVGKSVLEKSKFKPVISSSCPAVLRIIKFRFPELLKNIIDIETPVEITARIAKEKALKRTGLTINDIGVILITPCTARVTSIKNPIGIPFSYIDGTIPVKDAYGPMLKALSGQQPLSPDIDEPTRQGILWYSTGGQMAWLKGENTLAVDGIENVISILEEVEMGRFNNLSYLELTACPGSCFGGPLVIENRYITLNSIKSISGSLDTYEATKEEIEDYNKLYNDGFIRLTEEIKAESVLTLDKDIKKSIKKMDTIRNIVKGLPGINCGICGAPTCQAFAEDVVMGSQEDSKCPIMKIIENNGSNNGERRENHES